MYGDNLRFEGQHFGAMDFGSYGMGLGASVTPTGSQLVNVNTAINWGLNNLELTFGQMSFQQQGALAQLGALERDELIRLSKMNQVNLSLHAPHYDAAGNTGQAFSEDARRMAVREFKQVVDFAEEIGTKMNVKGVPIVIHGAEAARSSPDPNTMMYAVNRDNGNLIPLTVNEVSYQDEFLKEQGLMTPDGRLMKGLIKKDENWTKERPVYKLLPMGQLKMQNKRTIEQIESQLAHTSYYRDFALRDLDGARSHLEKLKQMRANEEAINKAKKKVEDTLMELYAYEAEQRRQKAELNSYKQLYTTKTPDGKERFEMIVPTDRYAKEKSVQTIVDVAKYAAAQKSQPKLVVENIFPEVVMGNPDLLADTIEEARKKFVNDVSRSKSVGGLGMSRGDASRIAKDMIGINFDIGHANLWKKYGKIPKLDKNGNYVMDKDGIVYTKANDDTIKKWAAMLQKKGLLKHVHITDNLGDQDAHMPVGWGNAPINDVVKMLRQQGWGKKGERAILETFGMVQYGGGAFGVPMSLYGMNMPLVSGGADWEMAQGSYFQAGYPMTGFQTFPDINYQMYGVGFGGLPYSTGGQMPGSKGPGSQFSGAPMS